MNLIFEPVLLLHTFMPMAFGNANGAAGMDMQTREPSDSEVPLQNERSAAQVPYRILWSRGAHLQIGTQLGGEGIGQAQERQQHNTSKDIRDQQRRPWARLLEYMLDLRERPKMGGQDPWLLQVGCALRPSLARADVDSSHCPLPRICPGGVAHHQHQLECTALYAG